MKRDVEYQLAEAKEQAQRRDPEAERRLRKALQKTKALLHDTQEMLQLEVSSRLHHIIVISLTIPCIEANQTLCWRAI